MKGIAFFLLIGMTAALLSGRKSNDISQKPEKSGITQDSRTATAAKEDNLQKQTNELISLGDQAVENKDYPSAIKFYQEALPLAIKRNHRNDQIYIISQIASVYDLAGDLPNAITWYNEALTLSQKISNSRNLAFIHNNLGNIYLKIGSFSKSLEHYQQALELKKIQGEPSGLANALMNMSIYYLKTGNYTQTLDYQMQALKLRQKIKDPLQIAATLSSIGVTYRHMEDYDKAFSFNYQALEIYRIQKDNARIASTLNNLGVLYLFTGDLEKARKAYLESLSLKENSKDIQSILSTLNNLADISLKLNRLQDAKAYLDKAALLVQRSHFYELNRIFYKLQSEYYEETGAHLKALDAFKIFHTLTDSLANVQKMKQLSELEVKYELLEKERNIMLLTQSNELSRQDLKRSRHMRNYLFIIIFLVTLIALILVWRFSSVLKLNRRINASRRELNLLNQELEKRVEVEVQHRQEQAQKALRQSRLAILGELAAGFAHELNQPMQTLSLTLENIVLAIQDKTIDASYLEQKLSYLFEDISRMQSVIEHIRRFSKQSEEIPVEGFDPSLAINNARQMVKDRFEKHGIKIELDLDPNLPRIHANQYKFEQVILNLLTNARDAIFSKRENLNQASSSPEKNTDLEPFRTSDYNTGGIISISGLLEPGNVIIKVEDNGCGIPPEIMDKVFDIFFSTKELDKGTGLGLSISAGILKRMNATLTLESEVGKGTVATVTIVSET